MTWPRWRAFEAHWRVRPPIAWVAGALVGWKAKEVEPERDQRQAATPDLIEAMFPNGRFKGA